MASEEPIDRARRLRRSGSSVAQIAAEIGIRQSVARRWVADLPVPDWTKRPRAKDQLRERARELRSNGANYATIAMTLGVSKSSVSLWVRDLPHPERTPEGEAARLVGFRRAAATRRLQASREREEFVASVAASTGPLTDRELLIAGAVAYWAEGSKRKPWRLLDRVVFINSDPDMILLFLAFLRLLGIGDEQIRIRVHIHESADVAKATAFWAETLQWPEAEFQRATLKRHVPKSTRRNVGADYHGCLVITVLRSRELYRRIEGMWLAVAVSALRVGRQSRVV